MDSSSRSAKDVIYNEKIAKSTKISSRLRREIECLCRLNQLQPNFAGYKPKFAIVRPGAAQGSGGWGGGQGENLPSAPVFIRSFRKSAGGMGFFVWPGYDFLNPSH